MASGRVSANRAVSSSGDAGATLCDCARHEIPADRPLLAAPRAAPRDEAPVAQLDRVEHSLLEPLRVDVLRVHAEPLAQRVPARLQQLAHPVWRRERVLGRDVIAVRRQAAQIGGALVDQRQPPVGEVRRDLHAHVGHQPPALAHERAHVVERDRVGPAGRLERLARRALASLHLVGDGGGLRGVVARVRHEVLEDHLLDVAVLAVGLRQRLQRRDSLLRRLADADEDPARERDAQLARGPDALKARIGVLGRRALVHDQVRVHRLQHQPL
jgi:hypothetical protein